MRVNERVKMGGHFVEEHTIRRRYFNGIKNFFELYQPLANSWQVFDNSVVNHLHLIAAGSQPNNTIIKNDKLWQSFQEAPNA